MQYLVDLGSMGNQSDLCRLLSLQLYMYVSHAYANIVVALQMLAMAGLCATTTLVC